MSSADSNTARRPRHRVRRLLLGLLALVLVVLLVAAGLVWRYGPRFGVYLVPPSPSGYADAALAQMENGYYASGPAWEQARAKAVRETREAKSYADTLPALREALAVAGGKHSHLFESGQSLSTVDTDRPMPTVTTAGGITTLVVPKASGEGDAFTQQFADTLANGIDGARKATGCGWVVDLRHNHGGDMNPMLAGLAALLPQGRVMGFRDRMGNQTWVEMRDGQVVTAGHGGTTVGHREPVTQPVAVLLGPDNGSSGEVTALALRAHQPSRSFGQPTAGYSSANQVVRLYDGTQMLVTTAVDLDAQGHSTDGGPVAPDQVTPVDQADEAATAWLRQQCR